MPRFRTLRPFFFSGLLDDPILWVQNRSTGKAVLFDCGQLHHLSKRLLMALEAVFISHTHMDHLMGIDGLFRHLHALPRTLHLFGPRGLADKIDHKLKGYSWNLAEPFWATFSVVEVGEEEVVQTDFLGPEGFDRKPPYEVPTEGDRIYSNAQLEVRARLCEHRIPSLIFRLDEKPLFLIDPRRLEEQGLVPGPWLGRLKNWLSGSRDDNPSPLLHREGDPDEQTWQNPEALYRSIQQEGSPAGLGYISDIAWNDINRRQIGALMPGIRLLVCECTFRADDMDKARQSAHLCTTDINELVGLLQPEAVLPMHMSKRYRDHGENLYRELQFPPGTELIRIPQFLTPPPIGMNDFS